MPIQKFIQATGMQVLDRECGYVILGDMKSLARVVAEESTSRYSMSEKAEFMLAIWRLEEGRTLADNYRAKYVLVVSFPPNGEVFAYIHDDRELVRKTAREGNSLAEAQKIVQSVFIPVKYFVPLKQALNLIVKEEFVVESFDAPPPREEAFE